MKNLTYIILFICSILNGQIVTHDGTVSGELIINGDFDQDSDWGLGSGWSISGGSLNTDGTRFTVSTQDIGMEVGKTYKIKVTYTGTSSNIIFSLSSFSGSTAERTILVGENNYILTANRRIISFFNLGGYVGQIDNISVKEYNKGIITYDEKIIFKH